MPPRIGILLQNDFMNTDLFFGGGETDTRLVNIPGPDVAVRVAEQSPFHSFVVSLFKTTKVPISRDFCCALDKSRRCSSLLRRVSVLHMFPIV